MGLSIAHQVLRREPQRKVVVLEKARNVGEGSTGAGTCMKPWSPAAPFSQCPPCHGTARRVGRDKDPWH